MKKFPTSYKFFKKNFSSFKPHTKAYVDDQIKALIDKNLPAIRIDLPKDTELVGLNVNCVDDLIHEAPPLYRKSDVGKLTFAEINKFRQMTEDYNAQLRHFKVDSNIECASTVTDSGCPVFFVHDIMTSMGHVIDVSEALNFSQYDHISSNP